MWKTFNRGFPHFIFEVFHNLFHVEHVDKLLWKTTFVEKRNFAQMQNYKLTETYSQLSCGKPELIVEGEQCSTWNNPGRGKTWNISTMFLWKTKKYVENKGCSTWNILLSWKNVEHIHSLLWIT